MPTKQERRSENINEILLQHAKDKIYSKFKLQPCTKGNKFSTSVHISIVDMTIDFPY